MKNRNLHIHLKYPGQKDAEERSPKTYKRIIIMNGYPDDSHRFDFVSNHARLGLVQRKTFEKIILDSDNNVIYEYEFQLKVKYFEQCALLATAL